MLKPRVGDLIRFATTVQFRRVVAIAEEKLLVELERGDSVGLHIKRADVVEVIRPANPRKTLSRKEAREWLRSQHYRE